MGLLDKKSRSFSIVMIGYFSPMMFQPYWFKYNGIISDDEFNSIEDNKEKTVVTNSLTIFETEDFFFKIEQNRFSLIAKNEPFELLLDLLSKLQEKLPSLLIKKFGLNLSFHVDLENLENMNKFGDIIAPKVYWDSFFEDADTSDKDTGLVAMGLARKTEFGFYNVSVESSAPFKNHLFFAYNYHFNSEDGNDFEIVDVDESARRHFKHFIATSTNVTEHVIRSVLYGENK